MKTLTLFEIIENKIIVLRNTTVMLDSDVAELYGVKTRDINKAVKNNPDKFPEFYILKLTAAEKSELVENFPRFNPLKHSTTIPKAFAEKGLYMLATILKSKPATQTTIAIIETFARLKNLNRNVKALTIVREEEKKKNILQQSSEMVSELFGEALSESETSVELNFAILKVKHTIKKKNDQNER